MNESSIYARWRTRSFSAPSEQHHGEARSPAPGCRLRRLGNINGILRPAGAGGPTRGHAIARMNTPSRQNAGDREGHVAAWGGPDAVGRGATSEGAAAPRRSAAKRWGRVARVGRDVGEEVSGGARRGPGGGGIGPLGREPELGKDPADRPGILNGREQAHAPPTAQTREHVTLEGAPHEVRPRPIARLAGRLLLPLHVAARARANGTCCHQRGRRALVGHGAGTPASMGGKDATARD
jgi:hypothetical protein